MLLLSGSLPALAQPGDIEDDVVKKVDEATAEGQPRLDDYDRARANAKAEAEQGHFDRAAAILADVLPRFEDDFALHLDHAFYLLKARRFSEAARAYRETLALNDESRAAWDGLADAFTAAEDFLAARTITAHLVEKWHDAASFKRHAFVLFSLGEYSAAESAYDRALALAPHDPDALAGLGWCAQRLDRPADARRRFRDALVENPASSTAREGLLLVGTGDVFLPHAFTQAWFFQNNSSHPVLWSVTTGMQLRLADRFLLDADYRHLGNLTAPSGADTSYMYSQDELHLGLGYATRTIGVSLYGAVAAFPGTATSSAPPPGDRMELGGLAARFTHWLTLDAALTWSHYSTVDVGQLDVGVTLPLARSFDLFAGGRLQLAADGVHGAARVEARVHGERWMVAANAVAGSQLHPYDLDTHAIYNLDDTLLGGAGVFGWLPLSTHVSAFAGWQWEHWQDASTSTTSTTTTSTSDSHRLTLGLSAWF